MVDMCQSRAVSAPVSTRKRACLLQEQEWAAYRCAETAADLGAATEEKRLQAFWLHYKTHVERYIAWATRKHLIDATVRYPDPAEGAAELVFDVLLSFHQIVQQGGYIAEKGSPCKYVKQAIRNKFQDILRRGRHPTPEECMQCWEERGMCPVYGTTRPWEQDRERCFRPPPVEQFDEAGAMFAAAGLQGQWPPKRELSVVQRPVEHLALDDTMIACIWALMPEVLTPDQHVVLRETFLHHKTSREIALQIDKSPGNVDQIRHRGLRRLYRALTSQK